MRTSSRVVRGVGWVAAAGLLALLVSTNCGTADQIVQPEACGPNGACPTGFLCNPVDNRCVPGSTTCAEGDPQLCPANSTCYPPTGPGECKPPSQVACDGLPPDYRIPFLRCTTGTCPEGQRCGLISVKSGIGGIGSDCGCIPVPAR